MHSNCPSVDQPNSPVANCSVSPSVTLVGQPETNPFTERQLNASGICRKPEMTEASCKEQEQANDEKQLIKLHTDLLRHYYDSFLSMSQHYSLDVHLERQRTAERMWKYAILPLFHFRTSRLESLECLRRFTDEAYATVTLLLQIVPELERTWFEYLGDLAGFFAIIVDHKSCQNWMYVSYSWYFKAATVTPHVGRLYYQLAFLTRVDALRHLFYLNKSLSVPEQFVGARKTMGKFFEKLLYSTPAHVHPCDAAFIRVQGILFTGDNPGQLQSSIAEFLGSVHHQITIAGKSWQRSG